MEARPPPHVEGPGSCPGSPRGRGAPLLPHCPPPFTPACLGQPCHRATASHWLSWGISQTHSAGTRPSLLLPALDLQARLWPRSPLLPKASPPAFGLGLLEWRRWAGARPRVGPVRAQLCTCGLSLALQQVADAAAPPHGCVRTRSSVGPAQSRAFPVGHLACPSPFTWLPWGSLTLSAQPVPSTPAGTPTTIGSR